MTGRLFGVGVGPGDPELLTLKAARILDEVPVVAYPSSIDGSSRARRIATEHIDRGKIEIPFRLAMNRRRHPDNAAYDAAAADIATHLAAGRDVAVICEGDPFLYGSFMYLFQRMEGRFEVEIVPGVSALSAGAQAARQPLVGGNEILTVLPAPLPTTALRNGLTGCQSAAIIKLGRHGRRVLDLLDELALTDRAWYVAQATEADQVVLPLRQADPERMPYFSMIVVRRGDLAA